MKKPLILIGTGMTSALFLAGCAPEPIVYEEKTYPVEDAAEIMEDKLEIENPGRDFEVIIQDETGEE